MQPTLVPRAADLQRSPKRTDGMIRGGRMSDGPTATVVDYCRGLFARLEEFFAKVTGQTTLREVERIDCASWRAMRLQKLEAQSIETPADLYSHETLEVSSDFLQRYPFPFQ